MRKDKFTLFGSVRGHAVVPLHRSLHMCIFFDRLEGSERPYCMTLFWPQLFVHTPEATWVESTSKSLLT